MNGRLYRNGIFAACTLHARRLLNDARDAHAPAIEYAPAFGADKERRAHDY